MAEGRAVARPAMVPAEVELVVAMVPARPATAPVEVGLQPPAEVELVEPASSQPGRLTTPARLST